LSNYIVIILFLGLVYLVCVLVITNRISNKAKRKEGLFYGKLNINKSKLLIWYDILGKIPFISLYLNHINRCFEVYCPNEKKINAKKTMIITLLITSICGIEIFLVFLLNPTFFNGIIAIILTTIINNELIYIIMRNAEVKLLRQMIVFFTDVRHYYYESRMVDIAILDATKNVGNEMKAHSNKIYDVLTADNMEKEVRLYNETIGINYLKLFLSSCVQVIQYGDKEVEEQSVFQMNLHHLKNEVQMEELKQSKLIYIFSGLVFMTVAPILSLDFCKSFGISNLPELTSFYEGPIGIGIYIASILVIILCYLFQNFERDIMSVTSKNNILLFKLSELTILKNIINNYTERFYTKILRLKILLKQTRESISYRQFLVKQLLYALIAFCFMTGLIFHIHQIKRTSYRFNYYEADNTSMVTSAQIEKYKEHISFYIEKYKDEKLSYDVIRDKMDSDIKVNNSYMKENIINTVLTRLKAYKNEYYRWYELVISILITVIAYYLPYWMLLYRRRIIRLGMDAEVVQFHSIILMLMYLDNISILTILETMEIFAGIFKTSIQECINDFNSGSEEALIGLKEKETCEVFRRLVDNLLVSDKIGIIKAFDEIAADRLYFMERRKQENEIILKKKADNATLIAYIPLMLIMTTYLIAPFIIQCIKDYQLISSELF
jgi:hypothetical protein